MRCPVLTLRTRLSSTSSRCSSTLVRLPLCACEHPVCRRVTEHARAFVVARITRLYLRSPHTCFAPTHIHTPQGTCTPPTRPSAHLPAMLSTCRLQVDDCARSTELRTLDSERGVMRAEGSNLFLLVHLLEIFNHSRVLQVFFLGCYAPPTPCPAYMPYSLRRVPY
eukprot:650561-Rhodomonas_salina.10